MSLIDSKQVSSTRATDGESRARRPLRFGIMCDSARFEPWCATCLRMLLDREDVELHLVILNAAAGGSGSSLVDRIRPREFLYQVYSTLFLSSARVDYSKELADVSELRCDVVRKGKYSQYFSEDDIKEIQSHDLDFILRFGFGIIRGEILHAARYGVWSFHHGDEEKFRGRPSGFWEIFHDAPTTGSILQRLTDRLDGGIILRKGQLRTVAHSLRRQRDDMQRMSAEWPNQVCTDILNGCAEYLAADPTKTDAPIYTGPTNTQMVMFAGKIAARHVGRALDRLFRHDHWNVGFVRAPIGAFLDPDFKPDVTWLPDAGRGKFFADPFAIEHRGRHYVLVEEFDYATGRGIISYRQLENPERNAMRIAFDGPHHLSYPFVLEHENEIYCIPESSAANEIALYRADSFPDQWRKVATLVDDCAGIDPTVFRHDDRWWMAFSLSTGDGAYHLYIYHADDLPGPWRPHAANPVKTDVRSARPAGTPFMVDGQLYRPAQDCSRTYGGRVSINRVTRLSVTEFDEEVVTVVAPDPAGPYPDGIHTISGAGEITVIDGKKIEFVGSAFVSVLGRTATRLASSIARPTKTPRPTGARNSAAPKYHAGSA